MSDKLTIKQELFCNNITNPNNKDTFSNGTKSYMKAYNTNNYLVSAVESNRNLKKPNIIKTIIDKLHEQGLTDEYLNDKLKDLTVAYKEVLSSRNKIIELRDNPVRLEALRLTYKLKKHLDDNSNMNIDARQVTFNIENSEELNEVVKELSSLNSKLNILT